MRALLAAFSVGMAATVSNAADCSTVMIAMEAQAAAPHYRQTMTMKGQPALESIVIGDVFYVLTDGKWNKIQLKPGGRLGMLKQIVPDAASIKDCSELGAETLDGVETTVMAYTPPPVPDMGESGPATRCGSAFPTACRAGS